MPWKFNPINLEIEFVNSFIYIPTAKIDLGTGDIMIDLGDHANAGDIDQGERVIDGDI